jgi:hypothetical protein
MAVREIPSALRPHGWGTRLLCAAAAGCLALAAWAQPFRIPDLRTPGPRVATAPPPGSPCDGCGRVLAIREIQVDQSGGLAAALRNPGPGTADPGAASSSERPLVGAVIYLPLGGQGADKPYVGGVGTPEMYDRLRETAYEIAVKLDDGAIRLVRRSDGSQFAVGDRVRWGGGEDLELLVN